MEAVTLNTISPIGLIAIGIFLIAVEAMTFSFVLFWFGVASVIVGVVSFFFKFSDGLWQLADIGMVALLMLFLLRAKALEKFQKPKDGEIKDNFFNIEGRGTIRNGKVYYKATYWDCDNINNFSDGEKVEVIEIKKGKAIIRKNKKEGLQ